MRKLRRLISTFTIACAMLAPAFAQQEQAKLATAENAALGNYLVDGEGRTLYSFLNDEANVSTCIGECLENWPALLTDGRAITAPGLVPGFVGSVKREDGTTQVTFRGHPLYYFIGDSEPGDVLGQGRADLWYVLSTTGDIITNPASREEEATEAASADFELDPAVMSAGQDLYMQICVACHAADGLGGQGGPSLVNRGIIANSQAVVDQIVLGGGDMPSFGHMYDNEQVAAIATFIRNTWGNAYGPVNLEDVNH
jgi:predicted lipoprotein with Yx(FWY)xxD motif/mono/diheme cytochrome c family protein